jgi:cytochrome c553
MLARPAIAAIAVAALVASDTAHAQDLEYGRHLANECRTCHRSAADTSAIPNIFGMAAPRLATLLRAYREKKLPNEVMQNIAGRLKDEDIDALATYFAVTKQP